MLDSHTSYASSPLNDTLLVDIDDAAGLGGAGVWTSEEVARGLTLTGLMTMPPWSDDAEVARPYFRKLRGLAEKYGVGQLSMGMSHDLEVAIEEGSTMVRVGTALFGSRKGLL